MASGLHMSTRVSHSGLAALLGMVVYARFGLTGAESALAGLGALTAFAVYYAVAARRRDRLETSNQLAKLARGAGDLAGQLAEFGRRLNAIEDKVESAVERRNAGPGPALAARVACAQAATEVSQIAHQIEYWPMAYDPQPGREGLTQPIARVP